LAATVRGPRSYMGISARVDRHDVNRDRHRLTETIHALYDVPTRRSGQPDLRHEDRPTPHREPHGSTRGSEEQTTGRARQPGGAAAAAGVAASAAPSLAGKDVTDAAFILDTLEAVGADLSTQQESLDSRAAIDKHNGELNTKIEARSRATVAGARRTPPTTAVAPTSAGIRAVAHANRLSWTGARPLSPVPGAGSCAGR
jgi:hypothetical protein